MTKPTKNAQKLIDNFDAAAQDIGWQRDQGYGSSVDRSEREYKAARAALIEYVMNIEEKANGR